MRVSDYTVAGDLYKHCILHQHFQRQRGGILVGHTRVLDISVPFDAYLCSFVANDG